MAASIIVFPTEGCNWDEIKIIRATEVDEWVARKDSICAIGFACSWGIVVQGVVSMYPIGWVYDFIVERYADREGIAMSAWRETGR